MSADASGEEARPWEVDVAYGDGSDDEQHEYRGYYPPPTRYQQEVASYEMSRLSISDRVQQVQGRPARTVPERRDSDDRPYDERPNYSPVRPSSEHSSDSELNTFHDRAASALMHTPFEGSNSGQAAQAGVPVQGHSTVYYDPNNAYNQPYVPDESTAAPMGARTTIYHEGSHIAARDQYSHPPDRDLPGAVVNTRGATIDDPAFLSSFQTQTNQMRANLEVLATTAASDPQLYPELRVWAADRVRNYSINDVHNHYATGGSDLADHLQQSGVQDSSLTIRQSRWMVGEAQRRADSGGQVVADIRMAMTSNPPAGDQRQWLAAGNIPGPKNGKAWNKQDQADPGRKQPRDQGPKKPSGRKRKS